jgi:hypothetical protein
MESLLERLRGEGPLYLFGKTAVNEAGGNPED